MKELVKQYLDHGLSRRQLMSGLSAIGMSTVAAKAVAQSLETFGQGGGAPASAMREVSGTGGALFVAQLKAAGVEFIFFNPSTGDFPIFDALVDEPGIQLIKGIQEGAVVAMADGYARASGKTGVAIVANIGLPNADPDGQQLSRPDPGSGRVRPSSRTSSARSHTGKPTCEVMTQPITVVLGAATPKPFRTTRRGLKPRPRLAVRVPRAATNSCAARRRCHLGQASSTCRCAFVPTRTTSRRRPACCSRRAIRW